MVEIELKEVDDARFPLSSARLIDGIFGLTGTVELPGSGQYRGHVVQLPIELSVSNVLSYEVNDTSGTDTLILESAEPFDNGLHLIGVIPCVVKLFTSGYSKIRFEQSESPVAFRRWWRWYPITENPIIDSRTGARPEDSVSAQPVLPIFVANSEDDDLVVAPDVARALEGMEPPEVGQGFYLVFDAVGRRGHLKINRFDIELERWEADSDISGFRSRIDRCLAFHSLLLDKTLDDRDYIHVAASLIFDENRKNQWPKWPGWLRKKMRGNQTLPSFPKAADNLKPSR